MREFMKEMDVSIIQELEEEGTQYYLNGEKLDLFDLLKN